MGGPFQRTDSPVGLDWGAWLGQPPKVDHVKQRCHGKFTCWHEYSGGKFTVWGAHHVYIAMRAIDPDAEVMGPTTLMVLM